MSETQPQDQNQEEELWFEVLADPWFLEGRTKYFKGERCKAPAEEVRYFCEQGWAKELSGQVPTSAPHAGEAALAIPDTIQGQKGKVN